MTKELTAFAKLFIEKNWFQRVSDKEQRVPVKPGDAFLKWRVKYTIDKKS